ncbi:MAG: LytR C-terminal domain-containing protein [Mycobacteriales bacterium]
MTRGASPWSDPAVDAGFAAAYGAGAPSEEHGQLLVGDPVPVDEVPEQPAATQQDEFAEAADAAARPITRTGRRARAPQPARLSPARAVGGAAVSVAGVLLGIGTLLWLSDDPSRGPGPVVQAEPEAPPPRLIAPVDPPAPAPAPVEAAPSAAPASPAAPASSAAAPAAPSVVVPVTVLNNSRRDGLAERGAARFRAGGWPVAATGNFRGRIPVTTVYYEPGQQASARAFAERFDGIARVRPRFATLPARGLVVVLTREYSA